MTKYYWTDTHGRLEIELTQTDLDSVCQSGSNDAAVAQLAKPALNAEAVRNALRETGGWDDEELADDAQNLERIMWVACWDCHESPEIYCM